ncbi:MAG: phosphatase PAP2 family protein [Bacteroidales bacterium]|nr:phosphatase PAP2 family protein [Bacteroidales bacterium]
MKIFILIFLLMSMNFYSQNLDVNILRKVNNNRNKSFDNEFNILSNTVSIPIIATGLYYTYDYFRSKSIIAKYRLEEFIIGSGSVFLTTQGLKFIIKRERPYVQYNFIEKVGNDYGFSMPSGHTSQAFFLAFNVSFYSSKWYIITPSVLWASLIAYSRMHLGVHFPSDVLVGIILASAISVVTHSYFNNRFYKYVGSN